MGDSRHKRKYVGGQREQMTNAWKQRVRDRLAENKARHIYPRDQVELAEAVGASDKSAITKMFKATSSKLVPKVCMVLSIPLPMQEHKEPDDLEAMTSALSKEQRDALAQAIRAFRLL